MEKTDRIARILIFLLSIPLMCRITWLLLAVKIRDEVLNGEMNGAAVLNMFLIADSELQNQECVCVYAPEA